MADSTDPKPKSGIQVHVPPDKLAGCYANFLRAGHTREEFVLDFATLFGRAGVVTARVILSPTHTKRLISALRDNVRKYEDRFGEIDSGADEPAEFSFGNDPDGPVH